jgi:hypothetical protein
MSARPPALSHRSTRPRSTIVRSFERVSARADRRRAHSDRRAESKRRSVHAGRRAWRCAARVRARPRTEAPVRESDRHGVTGPWRPSHRRRRCHASRVVLATGRSQMSDSAASVSGRLKRPHCWRSPPLGPARTRSQLESGGRAHHRRPSCIRKNCSGLHIGYSAGEGWTYAADRAEFISLEPPLRHVLRGSELSAIGTDGSANCGLPWR